MYRSALTKLQEWKDRPNRKPLIIRGARQVGKTWLMKEFGRTSFANTAYINFDNNRRMRILFEDDYDLKRIITALQIESGVKITPEGNFLVAPRETSWIRAGKNGELPEGAKECILDLVRQGDQS